MKTEKLVIIGAGETALLAHEYFSYDSNYEVVGFSVERKFINEPEIKGLPITPFDQLAEKYNPGTHKMFTAISYTALNRTRTRLYLSCKQMGFGFASYISSKAFIWRNVEIGENCFILENNVLQYSAKIGNNVILWSGNHIGHQSVIHDNVFLSSHVVISGYCEVGANCFLGVNSCVADNVKVARDNLIGAGAVVTKPTEPAGIYQGNPAERRKGVTSLQYFKVPQLSE